MKKQPLGFLWNDPLPMPQEKRVPPVRTWEAPDYLPGLEEAKAFKGVRLYTIKELATVEEEMVCDIEVYSNYFLCAFMGMGTGKVFYFEMSESKALDVAGLSWFLHRFTIITFNGNGFDVPLLALALDGSDCAEIKHACNMIIQLQMKPWQVLKQFKCRELEIDHIDLIEVCPLTGSLKIYGGRLHVPRMQDLPFHPETVLSQDQISIIRYYCINDLTTTAFLNHNLKEQLDVRRSMSTKYGIDLRSKSDAQIAEAVIVHELRKLGVEADKPEFVKESQVYNLPQYLTFQSAEMLELVEDFKTLRFEIGDGGQVLTPSLLYSEETRNKAPNQREPRKVRIGQSFYKIGIGGLHSCEQNTAHKADSNFRIVDRDVASYYPAIILNQGLFPAHLGSSFLTIYRSIVERRLKAKREKNNVEADMLKIVINGSFGKFGSMFSKLYSPQLLIQVTLTGQLSLLMLIERMEFAGIKIISANTDGIVMKFPRVMQSTVDEIVRQWELDTGFLTEETEYVGLYSRDVNNYLAVKRDGTAKGKGFCMIGKGIFRFHKNPVNTICIEAAIEYLTKGIHPVVTISACRDIRKFLTVQGVTGGAVKDGVFLGKAVRWYYAIGAGGEIIKAQSGNKVPKSEGVRPLMELPASFPLDVDFQRYVTETLEMLSDIGAEL